jgi:hypothetical protein
MDHTLLEKLSQQVVYFLREWLAISEERKLLFLRCIQPSSQTMEFLKSQVVLRELGLENYRILDIQKEVAYYLMPMMIDTTSKVIPIQKLLLCISNLRKEKNIRK